MKSIVTLIILLCFNDTFAQDSIKSNTFDTLGVSIAPVKVYSVKIVPSQGGEFRNIQIVYKNISLKKIIAIKFKWKGVDAFGDPADLGDTNNKGYGSGFTDISIKPNKPQVGVWNILSNDVKKILYAWPTEVAFEDGSKWKQSSN